MTVHKFNLLLLLDDDYERAQNYFESLCRKLCSNFKINLWGAASSIDGLRQKYKNFIVKPCPEDILIISDVIAPNARLDEQILRYVYEQKWNKKAPIFFFSSEPPTFLPEGTYWIQGKTGYPEYDAQILKGTIIDRNKADKIGEQDWDVIIKKLSFPWRLEYFLEISLGLLTLPEEKKIEEEFKKVIDKYEEAPEDLKNEVREIINLEKLKRFAGKTILDEDYATEYKEIYEGLKKLAKDEIESLQ